MRFVSLHIKSIMMVSGLLTCTMVYAALLPQAAFQSNFGETLEGSAAEVVVRSWGVLIAMVGGLLIYGAYRPAVRPLALVFAGISKLAFIGLVLSHGLVFLEHQVGLAVAVDLLWVLVFAWYLLGARHATLQQA